MSEQLQESSAAYEGAPAGILSLNVGGVTFDTTRSTLMNGNQSNYFSAIASGRHKYSLDSKGRIFIDRDPTYFRYILNFLRDGVVSLPKDAHALEEIHKEAEYYSLQGLINLANRRIERLEEEMQLQSSGEKEHKLVVGVAGEELAQVFNHYTVDLGYELESWVPMNSGLKFNLVFAKLLSRRQTNLLDNLMQVANR